MSKPVIDQERVSERAEELQARFKKQFLLMKLQEALGKEEAIRSLDAETLSELVAVFEQVRLEEIQAQEEDNE